MSLDTMLFSSDCITRGLHVTGKKQLLQEMTTLALNCPRVEQSGLSSRDILTSVMEREKLGTTGIGAGVAIPHARIPGLSGMSAAFATLETPIEYDAIDDRPVDLVVMLLAPENAGAEHLRALAKVSRILRREETRSRLRAAPNSEALHVILSETRRSTAA